MTENTPAMESEILLKRTGECGLRKQPSFIAPGPNGVSRPSRETPFGPEAMKDLCFRRLRWLRKKSFSEPTTFEATAVLSLCHWNVSRKVEITSYQPPVNLTGSLLAFR